MTKSKSDDRSSVIFCPKCQEELVGEPYRSNTYKFCFYCEGAWVQKSELDTHTLLELASSNSNKADLCCPVCTSSYLIHANLVGIQVDYCENCEGIYFERGELEQVAPNYKSFDKKEAKSDTAKAVTALILFSKLAQKVFSTISR